MDVPASNKSSIPSTASRTAASFGLRALPTAMIRSLKEFSSLQAIVLSALGNEQAEFPRLRKTAHALDSIKISVESLLKIVWGKKI